MLRGGAMEYMTRNQVKIFCVINYNEAFQVT